jgi:hypothetical protein
MESKREQKLVARHVNSVANYNASIADPKFPPWSHKPITFSRDDQWTEIPFLGRFPLILDPVIRKTRFCKVLINGGSGLNILFSMSCQRARVVSRRPRADHSSVLGGSS